jgi:hemerythrin-like domain-containing protein
MDPAIQMLYNEHRIIERIVGALGRLAALSMEGRAVPLSPVAEVIDLMRQCTDAYHHGKEEKILFPMLLEQSRYRLRVPVGVLNREHEIGRGHVREMAKASAEGLAGDWREVFARHAVAYQTLLRSHIVKEDRGLFPTADRALEEAARQDLGRRFEQFEASASEHLGDYRRRVLDLERGLGLRRA